MMMDLNEKAARFSALHARGAAFLMPNPWDAGSARLLEGLSFEALGTTSAGCAFARAMRDGAVPRLMMLEHLHDVARATSLPVSADLSDGYGTTLADVAETYRLAAATGIVGASIEDADATGRQYRLAEAVDRVRAAAEAVRALPFRFTLTARAENFLVGNPDLADVIIRLQAYQDAGAGVLFAPGLTQIAQVSEIVRAVDRPVSVLAGGAGTAFAVADLAAAGVARVSVGSGLARVALGAMLDAAREIRERGTFAACEAAPRHRDLNAMF